MKSLAIILRILLVHVLLIGLSGIFPAPSLLFAQEKGREDPERMTYFWRTALPPDDYVRALEMTGQSRALQKLGLLGDTSWTPIGPVGNFNLSSQNDNGRTRSIHVQSFGSDYYVYVGASSGGIWRARGSIGPVWTSLGNNLPNPAVGAFAVNPTNPDDILVGTGDYNRYGGAGIFRTTNAGGTWTRVTLPVSPNTVQRIYYLPGNSNIVLAATSAGLLRSTAGANGPWTVQLTSFIGDLVIHPTNANIQYACRATIAGTGGGVYRSTDAGVNWTQITTTGAPSNAFGFAQIAISRSNPNTIIFMYEWSNRVQAIKKSIDGGTTWADISGAAVSNDGTQATNNMAIAIRPNNANEFYAGMIEQWRSTDGGANWQRTDHDLIHRHDDQTQIYFSPVTGDNLMWFCNDGGVYRWTVGASSSESWNGNQTTGLRVSQVWQMDSQRDLRLAALQDVGVVGSTNAGASWTPFECCDGDEVEITEDVDMGRGLVFWFVNGVYGSPSPPWLAFRQTFSGARQSVNDPFSDSYRRLFFDRFSDRIYSVNVDASPPRVVSSPATGTLAWRQEFALFNRFRRITGSYLTGNSLFTWKTDNDTLTVLQRAGTSWTPFITNLRTNNRLLAIFASTERPGESWAGLGGAAGTPKVLHTTDSWRTWTNVTGSLNSVGAVNAIVIAPFNAEEIYAATDIGIFRTLDGGTNWEPFQSGLPIVQCTDLRYIVDRSRGGNDKLVVATFGHGLYERTLRRSPLVYVDLRGTGFEDGTFEHPYNTFDEGFNATPNRGMLALRGSVYTAPMTITRPLTLNAYESTATLNR